MRVVIVKKLLSSVGGSESQARALAAALRDRGHEVRLVALRPSWRRPGIPAGPPGDLTVRDEGVLYRYLATPYAAVDGLVGTSLIGARRLAREFGGADLVHCIAREWARPAERAARAVGAAFVETPLVHPDQRFSGAGRADIRRYARDDAVLALTEWEAGWYRERGARSVHVTGIGAVIDELPELAVDPATVLFVGRKERYKGYDALRAAAALVWRERPDARFHIVGQARFLGPRPLRDPRWVETGIVTSAEKSAAYARATVFCMPSEHETFGHTYLEAWRAGCPVIAGDIAPLREVVRSGVDGLHTRNEPAAIAAAILELLRDPERARRMGEAGRRRVAELWTWPHVAARTEAAYAAAIERHHGRGRAPEGTP
jgi:glycosyltransferase involved in cell wall biosynthesis